MASDINYKKSYEITIWLRAALQCEWSKLASNPIHHGPLIKLNHAEDWGYIVTGYFLLEQSLKALLHECKRKTEKTHDLYSHFEWLPNEHKVSLRAHYSDFVKTFPGLQQNIPDEIDEFLKNLDGPCSRGSLDWRYYLIEERPVDQLPVIDINLIHEIAFAICMTHKEIVGGHREPEDISYSFRLSCDRMRIMSLWCEHRMRFPDWDKLGNRIEKLWGPDYADRYTFTIIEEDQFHPFFDKIPDELVNEFPVHDMTGEFQSFQKDEAIKGDQNLADSSIPLRRDFHRHLMF